MKIRFHKNNLRLRLSQPEVAQLAAGNGVEERFEFPESGALSFSLTPGSSQAASFENDAIRIVVPQQELTDWSGSDREGIQFDKGPLKVAIEKDYQCLHQASPEDTDVFPNPLGDRF